MELQIHLVDQHHNPANSSTLVSERTAGSQELLYQGDTHIEDLIIPGNVSVIGRNNASIVSPTSPKSTRLVFSGRIQKLKYN